MKDLSIKTTLAGIGQTSIDLEGCARFTTTPKERVIWAVGQVGATAILENLVGLVGIPSAGAGVLVNTLGGTLGGTALLGSTILGLYGARQKAPWTGALGGTLVGITTTGCTILAAPILGGNPVGLTLSATLLGIGGAGGTLVAITTGLAAKHGKSSSKVARGFMGAGGFLLEVGIAGGLFCDVPIIAAISSSIIAGLQNAVASEFISRKIGVASLKAESKDTSLRMMLNDEYRERNNQDINTFKNYLNIKNTLSVINLGPRSISYNDLFHQMIEWKTPPEWLKILQPEIDLSLPNGYDQTPAHYILHKIFTSEGKEQKIYLKYLESLLADPRIDHQATLNIILTKFSDSNKNLDNANAIFKVLLEYMSRGDMQNQIDAIQDESQQLVLNRIIDTIILNIEPHFVQTESAKVAKVENDLNEKLPTEPTAETTNLNPDVTPSRISDDIYTTIHDKFNGYLDMLYLFGVDT